MVITVPDKGIYMAKRRPNASTAAMKTFSTMLNCSRLHDKTRITLSKANVIDKNPFLIKHYKSINNESITSKKELSFVPAY